MIELITDVVYATYFSVACFLIAWLGIVKLNNLNKDSAFSLRFSVIMITLFSFVEALSPIYASYRPSIETQLYVTGMVIFFWKIRKIVIT